MFLRFAFCTRTDKDCARWPRLMASSAWLWLHRLPYELQGLNHPFLKTRRASTRPPQISFSFYINNVMIRNALRLLRNQKKDRFIELRAMETPREPVRLVPGAAHLADSECTRLQKALGISRTDAPGICTLLCSLLTILSI